MAERRKGNGGVTYKPMIYALCDPDTGAVRYIGQTCYPRRRKWLHCSSSNNRGMRKVNIWVRSLLDQGKKPAFSIIEETTDLDARERYWIAQARELGVELLNMNGGGELQEHLNSSPRSHVARGRQSPLQFVRCQCKIGIKMLRKLGQSSLPLELALYKLNLAVEAYTFLYGKKVAVDYWNAALARGGYHA